MSARGKMPEGFDSLPFKDREAIVYNAPLGKTDRTIAALYFLDEMPQVEVAIEVHMDRSAVSRRLPRIRSILERSCN